jgi:type I restriction enzyme S subunit
LRFPEFEGEWEEKTLGDIADISKGSGISKDQLSEQGQLCILYGELYTKYKSEVIQKIISRTDIDDRHLVKSQTNDVIIPSSGETAIDIATARYIPFSAILLGGDINIIRLKKDNGAFLSYQLNGIRKRDIAKVAQGVSVIHLYGESLKKLDVTICSREEQNKIARFLSLLDERIATQNKIIEQYKSLIKGLSESLFFHKLGFENFERSWNTKYGEEIFENISDKNHDSSYPILAITQQHGAIPRGLIDYNVTVTDKSIENYKAVQIGDFIISLRSFQGGIEYSNYLGICSPAYIVLRPIIPINRIFYKYYLKTSRYIVELNKNLEGIRDGKMISYKQFSEISLPYPAITEQNKIANTLATVDSKLELERLLLEKYSEQKQYLLNNLFM